MVLWAICHQPEDLIYYQSFDRAYSIEALLSLFVVVLDPIGTTRSSSQPSLHFLGCWTKEPAISSDLGSTVKRVINEVFSQRKSERSEDSCTSVKGTKGMETSIKRADKQP